MENKEPFANRELNFNDYVFSEKGHHKESGLLSLSHYEENKYFSFKNSIPKEEKRKHLDIEFDNQRLNTDPSPTNDFIGFDDILHIDDDLFDNNLNSQKFDTFLKNQMLEI